MPKIPVSKDSPICSSLAWRAADPAWKRWKAVLKGVEERISSKKMTRREALLDIKKRLNAIRVLSKRKDACYSMQEDMLRIDPLFLRSGQTEATTRPVCKGKGGREGKGKRKKRNQGKMENRTREG